MRKILCCALGAAMAVLGWSAQTTDPAKKKSRSGKSATKSATTVHKKTAGVSKATGAHKTAAAPRKASTGTGAGATAGSQSATRTGSGKSSVARRGKKGTAPQHAATTWRNRQLAPTPDRYKEIQNALAAKGYLKPEEATGAWGPESADALKRFQADQNIEASGKISAMSLIALGLGPKHEAAVAKPPDPGGAKPPQEQPR